MRKYDKMLCKDDTRRQEILKDAALNGIDYLEVELKRQDRSEISIHFLNEIQVPGLEEHLKEKKRYKITGGVRVRKVRVIEPIIVEPEEKKVVISVNTAGDFSPYMLEIETPLLDPMFSKQIFSFKAGCTPLLDCRPKDIVGERMSEISPVIDYMAKDYASFRQALIDFISTYYPHWEEWSEADLGMVLVDLYSYVADRLSYYQDTVANEAYLETARQRISVKRHSRLIDYRMHDGSNARTFVHISVDVGGPRTIPARTPVVSKINVSLKSKEKALTPPHEKEIPYSVKTQALDASQVAFETAKKVILHNSLNRIPIHTWGNRQCWLPQGTTSLDLVGDLAFDSRKDGTGGDRGETWRLKMGDFLLLEEVRGAEGGEKAQANPNHRQVVRLTKVEPKTDSLSVSSAEPLQVTRVSWDEIDSLKFPLCVLTEYDEETGRAKYESATSVARGNLVLADHGRTIKEEHLMEQYNTSPGLTEMGRGIAPRIELRKVPLTFAAPREKNGRVRPSVHEMLEVDPQDSIPSIRIEQSEHQPDTSTGETLEWEIVRDLFNSDSFHKHFVVEINNDGGAMIRFGDGKFGMAPSKWSHFRVIYRVGNGTAGNVGGDTLKHIVREDQDDSDEDSGNPPEILEVRNPLPAWGGTEPETLDQVRLLAPKAFHAEQLRAVTEDDYAEKVEEHPEIDRAVAVFHWTGSWHTVLISVDPKGRSELTPKLENRVISHISRYRLAGYDIEIEPPVYVPLEIEVNVCAATDHFRAHVKEVVLEALGNIELSGARRGFFHPDNFTFEQPVYLSQLYEALEKVDGVDSAEVVVFKRFDKEESNELEQGYLPVGRFEIARLDNDPSFPERGILRVNMLGGK